MMFLSGAIAIPPLSVQALSTNPHMAVLPSYMLFDQLTPWILPKYSNFSVDLYIKNLEYGWTLQNASFSLSYNTPDPILSLLNVTVNSEWAGPNTIDTSTQDTIDVFVQGHPSPEGDVLVASVELRIIHQGTNPPQICPNVTTLTFSEVALWGSTAPIPTDSPWNGLVEVEPFLGGFVNIEVTNITFIEKTVVWPGYVVCANATIRNTPSFFTENVTVIFYVNRISIAEVNMTLASGESANLSFSWNTTEYPKGNYTVEIFCSKPQRFVGHYHVVGWVIVSMVGDLTGPDGWPDGKCDIRDIGTVAVLYGVIYPNPRYDPNCDVNNDKKIDIKDIATVAIHYGEIDP